MPDALFADIKPGLRRRLEFIDLQLLWNGRVNRGDIAARFRISNQQASADLADYERLAPGNLRYDRGLRAYQRGSEYRPRLIANMSDRYLMQLEASRRGLLPEQDTWFLDPPPFEVARLPRAPVDDALLQALLDAIRNRFELLVDYASMTGNPEAPRWIGPHAIAQAAGRWHARCLSPENSDYRDFNLNRILKIYEARPTRIDPGHDLEWHTRVDLVLRANPSYTAAKQASVRDEYVFQADELVVPTRISLVFYLLHEHNLEEQSDLLPEGKRPLLLVNREEVARARAAAKEMSKRLVRAAEASTKPT